MSLAVILVAAGAVQGATGFGFGMLAAPILVVIEPALVPGPMLLMGAAISISVSIREGHAIDTAGFATSLSGRIVATGIAALCLSLFSQATFSYLFAILILVAVALSLTRLRVAPRGWPLFIAGFASGFMGTITSIGAPPMALVYQRTAGPTVRATLSAFFAVGAVVSIVALVAARELWIDDVLLALTLLPFALSGLFLASWARLLVDSGYLRA